MWISGLPVSPPQLKSRKDPGRDAAATGQFSVGSPEGSARYKQTEHMWAAPLLHPQTHRPSAAVLPSRTARSSEVCEVVGRF